MIIKNSKNYAINILSSRNVVDSNTIIGGDTAIYLGVSMSNIITHNNISVDKNFGHGLVAMQSFNNTIKSNTIRFSGLSSNGINLVRSTSNVISDNKIMGNGWIGGSGISTRGSQYNILKNNWIKTRGIYGSGIYIGASDDNSLEGNKVEHSDFSGSGITIYFSSRNNVSNNTACSKGQLDCAGVFLRWSNYNTIYANRVYSTGWEGSGVTLIFSNENKLAKNDANNSSYGIYLGESDKNNVEYNIAQHNSDHDIYIDFFCVDTSIKHNTASLYIVEPRWSHIEDNFGSVKELNVEFPDEVPIFTLADITDLIYNISQFILVRFNAT
jgi:parallel beta-helix repeat protein